MRLVVLVVLIAGFVLSSGCRDAPKPGPDTPRVAKPFLALFPSSTPALPPPARGIAFGMTLAEAAAAVPAVGAERGAIDLGAYGDGLRLELRTSWPVNANAPRIVAMELPLSTAQLDAVVGRWGAPEKRAWTELDPHAHGDRIGLEGLFWFAPEARLRALAIASETSVVLSFGTYLATDDVVGAGPGAVPQLGARWLGSALADLEAELSGATWSSPRTQTDPDGTACTEITAELPSSFQWGRPQVAVHFRLRDGRVVGYKLRILVLDPEAAQLLLDALQAKWGTPHPKAYPPKLMVYQDAPEVAARYDRPRDDVTIYVGDIDQVF